MGQHEENQVLLVDDEQNVLEGFHRHLRNRFNIITSSNPVEALKLFEKKHNISTVVSDFKMPGINGVELLSRIKEVSPSTIRIILTGQADFENTIKAVNEGNIFRFLTKPCPLSSVEKAITEAQEIYNLYKSEKQLLEQTLKGSIRVLSEILSMVNPEAFGKAARLQELARLMAKKLEIKNSNELDIASLLSQIGCVVIPQDILQKSYKGEPLTRSETLQLMEHPATGGKLISPIPRLDRISYIISNQNKNHQSHPEHKNPRTVTMAKILSLANHFDTLLNLFGGNEAKALKVISDEEKKGLYESNYIWALQQTLISMKSYRSRGVLLKDLTPSMILAEDIITTDGRLLIGKGQQISETIKARLLNQGKIAGIREPVMVVER